MKAIELFGGVGGLALGCHTAGFEHDAFIEWDANACATVRANQQRELFPVNEWRVLEADVRHIDFSTDFPGGVEFLAGGPPCQPFSLGGKHLGKSDERNMFPETVRAVRELRPLAFAFENVRGLLRKSFRPYFNYIILQLRYPEVVRRGHEEWTDHSKRLSNHAGSDSQLGLSYDVDFKLFNAADFGVPQSRHRVFIVGFRKDLNIDWEFPEPTHSQSALLWSQWVDGSYWKRHQVAAKNRPAVARRYEKSVARLRSSLFPPQLSPWRTVRDALWDLPDPRDDAARNILNHDFNDGARVYPGHTGSPIDMPSKTLKAGDHGVPGGENMIAFDDGTVRYFTIRESARLQSFPENYFFPGSWSAGMRQLGNAVPVELAHAITNPIRNALYELRAVDVEDRKTHTI